MASEVKGHRKQSAVRQLQSWGRGSRMGWQGWRQKLAQVAGDRIPDAVRTVCRTGSEGPVLQECAALDTGTAV